MKKELQYNSEGEKETRKKESLYYENLLSKEQKELTGMEKFKEALRLCEMEMEQEEQKERERLGEKAFQEKKDQQMQDYLQREEDLDEMEAILFQERPKSWYTRLFHSRPKKVAVILCSILAASLLVGATGIAFRSPLADFVIQMFDKSSLIKMDDFYSKNENEPQDVDIYYNPTYIPNGYELEREKLNVGFHSLLYKNIDGTKIKVYQTLIKTYNQIDIETGNYELIKNNGMNYYYLENNDRNSKEESTIIWFDSQYQFQIIADVSLEELLKIAESMEKIQ